MKNQTLNEKKKNIISFIFKAKSIEKNIIKYPVEDSNKFLVKEENKKYTDPLTLKQENIPSNLRGTKYYMNYLYNIHDKDLKVKDNFIINHWEDEVLGKKEKLIKIKPLPERLEAFYVFNDKKLKLKKYKYMYYNDEERDNENENDLSYVTLNLKYLPLNVLALTSKRQRDFGKFAMKKEINQGALSFRPDTMFLSTTAATNYQQLNYTKTRCGKTTSNQIRSKGVLMMSSAFAENDIIQDEIKYKRNACERIYKKLDEFNYLTLSHYFLNETKLYYLFIDAKKQKEMINNIKDNNRKKCDRINVRDEILKIMRFDLETNSRRYIR
jgi:hypothetical protein